MSVGVLPGARCFHWESASKPALTRCDFRPAASTESPCHLRRHRHHRTRRRHESPGWTRRSSEVTPPSLSSWSTDTSSIITSDSPAFSVSQSPPRPIRPTPSPAALLLARNSLVSSRMSGGVGRGAAEGPRGTSTAAAREVKQYLSRTLFPRPASTLHGYASLYRRLTQLPTQRKLRGRAGPQAESDPESVGCRHDGQLNDPDEGDTLKSRMPSPPRVEIHIYVPTAAATPPPPVPHEEEGPLTF